MSKYYVSNDKRGLRMNLYWKYPIISELRIGNTYICIRIRNTDYSFHSWLERFIQDGGMQVIAKELGIIHKKQNR